MTQDNTTLHEAAWRGYSRIIRLLCHNDKTKLNLKNKQGHTALHLAAQKGHNQSCRIILLSGCKPNKKNNVSYLDWIARLFALLTSIIS